MNKTEAKFTTVSVPQVAFLLWKRVLPDKLEQNLSHNLFLYFGDDDYTGIVRRYWEGDYIPACEMGSCIRLVTMTIKNGKIDKPMLLSELDELNEYRAWYCCGMVEDDTTIGEEEYDYFDIIEKIS